MRKADVTVRWNPSLPIGRILGRLIRNPAYGGPSVGPFGWTWRPEINKGAKPEFNAALAESIRKEGVRNPVLVYAFQDGIYLTFGGSRVRAAQEAGLETIPAIINDYSDEWILCDEVTADNVALFFTDVPRDMEFGERGFDYHYNLERARRQNHDPAGFAWVDGTPTFLAKEFPWLVENS